MIGLGYNYRANSLDSWEGAKNRNISPSEKGVKDSSMTLVHAYTCRHLKRQCLQVDVHPEDVSYHVAEILARKEDSITPIWPSPRSSLPNVYR
jgi:hypothetical protein